MKISLHLKLKTAKNPFNNYMSLIFNRLNEAK